MSIRRGAPLRWRLLATFLFAHLILVTFQFVLRATLLDTTFYRDVLLVFVIGFCFAMMLLDIDSGQSAFHLTLLDVLFSVYLAYGILLIVISAAKGVPILQSLLQFRNQFLPACLYFVARYALRSRENLTRFVRIAFGIMLLLFVDVFVEEVFRRLSLPRTWLPWYGYFFRHSDRFVGNVITGVGYVEPAHSPVLGVLGWPHYTVVPLMALFALIYPFLSARFPAIRGRRRLGLGSGLSGWPRRILIALALAIVVILNVRTHVISAVIILLGMPLLLDRKLLRRNLLILLSAICLSFWIRPVRQQLIDSYRAGFIGDSDRPAVAELIFTGNELRYLASLPIEQKLFGIGDVQSSEFSAVGAFEMRIVFFTVAYGMLWFGLFAGIYGVGVWYAMVLVRRSPDLFARTFALGTAGLLVVYLIDMVHYARLMYFPNLDFWAVSLGCLANLRRLHPLPEPSWRRAQRLLHWRQSTATAS